jgi:hypothetical protein
MTKMNWDKVRQQKLMSRTEEEIRPSFESNSYVMPEMLTSEQIAFIIQENLVERYNLQEGALGSMSRSDGDRLLAKYAAELRETANKAMALRRHWDDTRTDGNKIRGEKGSVKPYPAKGEKRGNYQGQPATPKQMNLMRKYKMNIPTNCTKLQASAIISEYAKANWESRPNQSGIKSD